MASTGRGFDSPHGPAKSSASKWPICCGGGPRRRVDLACRGGKGRLSCLRLLRHPRGPRRAGRAPARRRRNLQDAVEAFLDQRDLAAPLSTSTGPRSPAWSRVSAQQIAVGEPQADAGRLVRAVKLRRGAGAGRLSNRELATLRPRPWSAAASGRPSFAVRPCCRPGRSSHPRGGLSNGALMDVAPTTVAGPGRGGPRPDGLSLRSGPWRAD